MVSVAGKRKMTGNKVSALDPFRHLAFLLPKYLLTPAPFPSLTFSLFYCQVARVLGVGGMSVIFYFWYRLCICALA
jgi:hypothetical protein